MSRYRDTIAEATAFFYAHAGYSYRPRSETDEEGHQRCAEAMAHAERWAWEEGYGYEWVQDDQDSTSFEEPTDEAPQRPLWVCVMWSEAREVVASCGGIDISLDPYDVPGDHIPYCRVMEAELAWELHS